jgi:hypothetical protein
MVFQKKSKKRKQKKKAKAKQNGGKILPNKKKRVKMFDYSE